MLLCTFFIGNLQVYVSVFTSAADDGCLVFEGCGDILIPTCASTLKKNRVYGILFDVSWLWEQYLAIILKQIGFIHPENRKGVGSIAVLTNNIGRFIPDFYRDDFVLDAKYKHFDKKNPPSNDLAQVIAYMHILKTMKGGYIYPSENEHETILNALGEIKGMGGMLYLCPFYIPQYCSSFSEFSEKIRKMELQLVCNHKERFR